jgi:hypothetical protein
MTPADAANVMSQLAGEVTVRVKCPGCGEELVWRWPRAAKDDMLTGDCLASTGKHFIAAYVDGSPVYDVIANMESSNGSCGLCATEIAALVRVEGL